MAHCSGRNTSQPSSAGSRKTAWLWVCLSWDQERSSRSLPARSTLATAGSRISLGEDRTLGGMNVLGRLLMELREQLKADTTELKVVKPLPIPEFVLLHRPIETILA